MKNLVLILGLIITLSSCSKNEESTSTENSILGTWQLHQRTANTIDGTPNDWEQVENGYKITFNEDFSYESEINPSDCNQMSSSSYVIQNELEINILEITITCNNPDKAFKIKDSYTFDDSTHLILTPINPACAEGCAFKFKKII